MNKLDKIEWKLTKIGENPAQMSPDRKSAHVKNREKHKIPCKSHLDWQESMKIEQNHPKISHKLEIQNENR